MRGFLAGFFIVSALLSACPGGVGDCLCVSCSTAVNLNVVDTTGNPVGDGWSVEASLDGEAVDTSACDPEFRAGQAFCFFGTETGVYHVIVHAVGRPDKEIAVRFPGHAGMDCCSLECVPGETVVVTLADIGGT